MVTIVIADDEKLIRAGLKKILTAALDIPLKILEAKNGGEAFALCETQEPELLITDIRMPVMNGIDLMKKIATLEHKPEIIVLSGYDDFSYAKAAIENKATTYLLKPVDKHELIDAVHDAISISQKKIKRHNEQLLRAVINEGRINGAAARFNFGQGLYYVSIAGHECMKTIERELLYATYYVMEQKKDYVSIALAYEGKPITYDKTLLHSFVVGVSTAANNFSMIRTSKRQAYTACMQAFFNEADGSPAPHIRYGIFRYEGSEQEHDFSAVDKAYDRFVSIVDIASPEEARTAVDALFDFSGTTAAENAERLYHLYTKIVNNLFTQFSAQNESDMYLHLKSIMIESIYRCTDIRYWISAVRNYALYLNALLIQKNAKEYPYISDAIEYVKTHYTKNINMAMVANQVSVNYTWFSEKFKEHTGVNFNEYLKRLRIEEAKRLLEKGCYKVYEVAQRSGFGDIKYFMKVFRENTGMSPSEWKNKHANR